MIMKLNYLINMIECNPIFKIFLLLVCLGLFGFGVWNIMNYLNFKNKALETKGIILGYHSKRKGHQGTFGNPIVHAPAFSYKPINSMDSVKIQIHKHRKNKKYKIGQLVTVYYNPNKTKTALLNDSFNWSLYIGFIVVAIIGFYIVLKSRP
ncbi:DUF3592 domain-containing protein [Zobellia amurskyensis]|uniref:DUF3592 domain-containing protein n=2 Tax=Zobellia amurskyensis TaxID=248905 RepID=A0A7X2ZQU1_9FLAO|nr:DUF3592 domain-containing protein [Zobellia amurskyensis]